ncbi:12274_t:CDS:10, partial [Entrophospora sp. SA101]
FNPNLNQNIFPINDNDATKIDFEQKSRCEPLSNDSSIFASYNLSKNGSTTSKDDNNAQHDKNKVTFDLEKGCEDIVKNDKLDHVTVVDDELLNFSEDKVTKVKSNDDQQFGDNNDSSNSTKSNLIEPTTINSQTDDQSTNKNNPKKSKKRNKKRDKQKIENSASLLSLNDTSNIQTFETDDNNQHENNVYQLDSASTSQVSTVNDEYIEVKFHVHLPQSVKGKGDICVVGSIKELGEWIEPVVKLCQQSSKFSKNKSIYWFSNIVKIPLQVIEENHKITYKYAIFLNSKQRKALKNDISFEGFDGKYERLLETSHRNHYDIWKDNDYFKISFGINNYEFVNTIYNTLDANNLNDKLFEFDTIFQKHKELVIEAAGIHFIEEKIRNNKFNEQKFFLIFLLGIHGKNNSKNFQGYNFKPHNLLDSINQIKESTFPSQFCQIALKGIIDLVYHIGKQNSLDWLNIFSVANILDKEYSFLDSFSDINYDNNTMKGFFEALPSLVKPYIDDGLDINIYTKIAKWLIELCNDMSSIVRMWSEVIVHSSELDEKLQECMVNRIDRIISNNNSLQDPTTLLRHYLYIPIYIRHNMKKTFRTKILDCFRLSQHKHNWKDEQVTAILDLILKHEFDWPKQDFVSLVKYVRTVANIKILLNFPILLDKFFEKYDLEKNEQQKILEACVTWFNVLCDQISNKIVPENEDGYVYQIFDKLSSTHDALGKRDLFWNEILEAGINRIKKSQEQYILKATCQVIDFPALKNRFYELIKELFNTSNVTIDNNLITKVKIICNCTSSNLDIPNELCGKIIYHIVSCLSVDAGDSYYDLIDQAEFWKLIFDAQNNTEILYTHKYIQIVSKKILKLSDLILQKRIDVSFLQGLLKYDDELLYSFFKASNIKKDTSLPLVSKDVLVEARRHCEDYEQKLEYLYAFYVRFCPSEKVDISSFLDDIKDRRNMLDKITYEESKNSDHWNKHDKIFGMAIKIYNFRKSQVFYNMFEEIISKINVKISLEYLVQSLMPKVFERFNALSEEYVNWKSSSFSTNACIWKNVVNIDDELNLFTTIEKDTRLLRTLKFLSMIEQWIGKLNQLSQVTGFFNIPRKKNDWLEEDLLYTLNDQNLTLGKLSDCTSIIELRFSRFDDSWALIKELSVSGEFIKFLQSIAGHDINHLINSVDDHSDERLIQEDTVSSLMQVKQSLLPLMNEAENSNLDAFISDIRSVTDADSNFSLPGKIILCNSHFFALQNLYLNISKKEEVTKDKIINAVEIGVYKFRKEVKDKKCSVVLTYSSKKTKTTTTLDFNALHDLRGRALLIAKPASINTDFNNNIVEKQKKSMDEFVNQVDMVQEIIDLISKLIESGHFDFKSITFNLKGRKEISQQIFCLKKILLDWEDMVNMTQKSHYYMTFYPPRHILTFQTYFTIRNAPYIIKKDCQTLIRFVHPNAKLPNAKLPNDGSLSKKDVHLKLLREIGKILEEIFRVLPRHSRNLSVSNNQLVISDVVEKGKLFVAACNDKSKIPNIIMSLYVNHKKRPEPWEVLVCTKSTTEGELSIFVKRCFLSARNGFEGHLFCIANLELLDFELQHGLVKKIQEDMAKKETDFYLALICFQQPGTHHHILEEFSENVQPTNGLNTEAMKHIFHNICCDVICVTSNLSGQGKTEWIKQDSFKKNRRIQSFLISDDANFENIVRELKECHIKNYTDLHINIISANHPEDVNMFLFQILMFGFVSNSIDIVQLQRTNVYIEISSSVENHLLDLLPFTSYLKRVHLDWDIKNFIVSKEIHSPIQIVCHYLNSLDLEKLDSTEISFRGPNSINRPLNDEICRNLLEKYFFERSAPEVISYRFLEIFTNVLADQLIRLSSSSFFKVENLNLMVEEKNIRTTLLNTLMDVSKDFSIKSFKTKSAQSKAISKDVENSKLEDIIRWDDSNHLLVFFLSQVPDSIYALYRDKTKVPDNVRVLLKSQNVGQDRWQLDDYHKSSPEDLLEVLEKLARRTTHNIDYPLYALSTDNLLKMAMILLRTRANIPVVICGEAGCGKTSLIGFLAKIVEAEFMTLNLHAGIQEQDIINFMTNAKACVNKGEVWLFFDEINTCNHIGLLADLIAHRLIKGIEIHPKIRLFAACNPYRIRTRSISQVGLEVKNRIYNEQSDLVYQVKPIPDQILDYVWDYGVLESNDEKKYIEIMVKNQLNTKKKDLFAKLLFESQKFIREIEEPYSVSLRDVKRAIKLVKFFEESLKDRPPIKADAQKYPRNIGSIDITVRSYVLSLALSYQARIARKDLREQFRKKLCEIFQFISEKQFINIIREEQEDYINRMILPPNTAKNEALLENVLVMIVCILTKIPVFIIGSPGSSKSLAIRLVSQSLRGSDSNDQYFRRLPQIYIIPHQGSSSSTSDGILNVFEKAQNFQNTSSEEFPVISVVLLDEVGLAETSSENPLKVLHSLLEPSYPAESPTVSVIGISNWRLDNSKSSRALLVQRPKFELKDLVDISTSLLTDKIHNVSQEALQPLAEAYSKYEKDQELSNFHGLRDYYSLVKSLSLKELTPDNIQMALARNFGGTEYNDNICKKYFKGIIEAFNSHHKWNYKPIPVSKLIDANINEDGARHLMLIGKSDSLINIITYKLREKKLDPVVILGSHFPEDNQDYSYSILNKIMMCVEAGKPLILTDLEIIYGSLYDLWNQNYIVVGSKDDPKYYTRVALGAFSNPMLHVHKDFRCILIMSQKNLEEADPPLLNRFEKQKITLIDILTNENLQLVKVLKTWVEKISKITDTVYSNDKFTECDLFIGYNEDETLQSLVIDVKKNNPNLNDDEILELCKGSLIAIATSDGIIRAEKSGLSQKEVNYWKNVYLKLQFHDNIVDYIKNYLLDASSSDEQIGECIIVNTFSNINTDLKSHLRELVDCFIFKLSEFKTESSYQNRIKDFWFNSESKILILQCDVAIVDEGCIKLAKFIIEQYQAEYFSNKDQNKIKHVFIILHIYRDSNASVTTFNFMCGWKQVTIESLVPQEKPLSILLDGTMCEIINNVCSFEEILKQELLWCLLCMKYPSNSKSVEHIRYLNSNIQQHQYFVKYLKDLTMKWLEENSTTNWQYSVASNKKLLYPYSSFSTALQYHIHSVVREPIAKILCMFERLAVTKTFITQFNEENQQFQEFIDEMIMNKDVIKINELEKPEPDRYIIPSVIYDLKFPFSYYYMKQIDSYKSHYEQEINIYMQEKENIDPETGILYEHLQIDFDNNFAKKLFEIVSNGQESPLKKASDLYFQDFISVICANEAKTKERNQDILKLVFKRLVEQGKIFNPVIYHIIWWRHSKSILAEFHLASNYSNINSNLITQSHDQPSPKFRQFIVKEVAYMMLKNFLEIKDVNNNISNWQTKVFNILSLSTQILNSSSEPMLFILQTCHDLLSTESIIIDEIKHIIKRIFNSDNDNKDIDRKGRDDFLEKAMEILYNLDYDEKTLIAWHSIFKKCLEILPIESPVRINLYKKLFSDVPFPLMGTIIKQIFQSEENIKNNIFFELVNDPRNISPRLDVIDKCLKFQQPHSRMSALCSDIIQKTFFSQYDLHVLSINFRQAIAVLHSNVRKDIQLICAISLLKEFVHRFWDTTLQEDPMKPIYFDLMETNNFNPTTLIEDINESMGLLHPLIHSLKVYFLRNLRFREFSMSDIKKFCEMQYTLPWLGSITWDNQQQTGLSFNPFWPINDYVKLERYYSTLYSFNMKSPIKEFFDNLKHHKNVSSRIALIGIIFVHLHSIKAVRERTDSEDQIVEYFLERIGEMSDNNNLNLYKTTVRKLLNDEFSFLRISNQTNNKELLIKSMILHTIAIHSSTSQSFSPLSYYLQRLENCKNDFIMTCPSDIQSVIINAVVNTGQATRAYEESNCPQCNNKIGGLDHVSAPGNIKIDSNPITRSLEINNETGYIMEPPNNDTDHNVRFLPPNSYFMDHIFNDWDILKKRLDCSNKDLALFLHSILHKMTTDPLKSTKIRNASEREQLEKEFHLKYFEPQFTNFYDTINNFRTKLNQIEADSKGITSNLVESEIDETVKTDETDEHYEKYSKDYLPKLWRVTGDTSYDNLKAFFNNSNSMNQSQYLFLSIYFNHDDKLKYIKHLEPILKFVKILADRLEYRLLREEAQKMTFKEFIDKETNHQKSGENYEYLMTSFKEFSKAWNFIIDKVNQFQCHELPSSRPKIDLSCPIIFGLVESEDTGIYICAIIDYLIGLQNNFLKEVNGIPIKNCSSLKILKLGPLKHMESMKLENMKSNNYINFDWDDELLQYSQINLKEGHGKDIIYDLLKIEDVKNLIKQSPIPNSKFQRYDINSLTFDSASEILSSLEILLCFIKRTATKDGNMLIKEFVENWMKLSSLLENKTFSKLLKSELRLRHVIALYELIEEQVSIKMVQYIDNKYKVPIDEETKEIIIKFVKFDQFSIQEKKLPAEDFIIALRRFMYRTLLGELNNENENLVYYFTEISLNLWPNHIKEELISELFPDEFLMCNIYCIYEYIVNEFEMYNKKQQYKVSLSSQNHHSRSNHMSSYKRELVDCEEDKTRSNWLIGINAI